MDIIFQESINRNEIQRLQEQFCRVTGLYIYCLDHNRKRITKMSGEKTSVERMLKHIGSSQIESMLDRIEGDSLEELVVEEMEEGLGAIATLAIKVQQEAALYWIILEDRDYQERKNSFLDAIDLIRDFSNSWILQIARCQTLETLREPAVSTAVEDTGKAKELVDTIRAMVQLLESEEPVEKILHRWLQLVSDYLQVDSAHIFRIYEGVMKMDVLSERLREGFVSFFDQTSEVLSYSFLYTEKPMVISTDNIDSLIKDEMRLVGIRAVMVFPLSYSCGDTSHLVVAINQRHDYSFSVAEIKFARDAVSILQSILTRKNQKDYISSSYSALESVLDHVGSSICVYEQETGKLLFINQKCKKTFNKEIMENTFETILKGKEGDSKVQRTIELLHKNRVYWYEVTEKEIIWLDGSRAVLYALYDITEKKIYQNKIEQQAYTDFLTGLCNRMCCEKDLSKMIEIAKRDHTRGALLFLDLDDFKYINDGLGHQYGDVLLRAIAHALQRIEGVRESCYRVGGDEFIILVPPNVYPQLDQIMEDISVIFNKPWFLKNADYYCTMSMGVITFPDNGDSVQDLIKKADLAMNESKKSGKNRILNYNDSIDSISSRRLNMEKNMRDAAGNGCQEFQVYYQPIFDIQEGKHICAGAEALVRWNSTNLGFISPGEFIPLAEYLGLISPIGSHVLREACNHCKKWNEGGFPDYKVNVNLSVVQLLQPDIVDTIERALLETGINPSHLMLEVTESLAINDMERMKTILNRIKALGVQLALDDFGTGYSSLNHIREIPFDVIKVDQSFARELAKDAYSQAFIKMVSELAQTIGVNICVEGIETLKQYEALQGMKVKYVQGFYFDKPMPQNNFSAKYCRHNNICGC